MNCSAKLTTKTNIGKSFTALHKKWLVISESFPLCVSRNEKLCRLWRECYREIARAYLSTGAMLAGAQIEIVSGMQNKSITGNGRIVL
jgi:hypothetical protein